MKFIIILLMFFLFPNLYALTVSDFSLINMETNKYVSFYDEPAKFLEEIGKRSNFENLSWTLISERENSSVSTATLKYEDCEIEIRYMKNIKVRFLTLNIFSIDYIRIFKNFKTIRGIEIGSSFQEVIEKYPTARICFTSANLDDRNLGKDDNLSPWEGNSLWDIDNFNKYNCIMIFDFMNTSVRAGELNVSDAMLYGLKFYFDENKKVNEIKIYFENVKS